MHSTQIDDRLKDKKNINCLANVLAHFKLAEQHQWALAQILHVLGIVREWFFF